MISDSVLESSSIIGEFKRGATSRHTLQLLTINIHNTSGLTIKKLYTSSIL